MTRKTSSSDSHTSRPSSLARLVVLGLSILSVPAVRAQDCDGNGVCTLSTRSDKVHAHKADIEAALAKFNELSKRKYPPLLEKRQIAVNQLNGNTGSTLFSYHGPVSVGTPSNQYRVLFDTGSSRFWLQGPQAAATLKGPDTFDCSKSSSCTNTNQKADTIEYVDGTTINGVYVKDTVTISNLTISGLQFEMATSAVSPASQSTGTSDIDGIMGMSFPSASSSLFSTSTSPPQFWQTLIDNKKITSPVFAYYIDETEEAGGLTFGGIDTNRFGGTLGWLNVVPVGGGSIFSSGSTYAYWQVKLDSMSIGGNSVSGSGLNVVWDTGTSLAVVPTSVANSINTALGLQRITDSEPYLWGAYCPTGGTGLPNTPDITLTFSGQSWTVRPNEYYFKQVADSSGRLACISGFAGQNIAADSGGASNTPNAIFGNVLLRRFYSVFDTNGKRIGLAVANRAQNVGQNLTAGPTTGSVTGNGPSEFPWGKNAAVGRGSVGWVGVVAGMVAVLVVSGL
ncbi:Vacuolar protease A [Rhizophlyctis rosea]|nr:Vacuolar protease A [Rhizophlyctis rosea]